MAKDPQQPDLDPATPITGRLLIETHINSQPYSINSIVTLRAEHAAGLVEQGALDTAPESIAYAASLGFEPIDLSV